jgi:hypothetical protein
VEHKQTPTRTAAERREGGVKAAGGVRALAPRPRGVPLIISADCFYDLDAAISMVPAPLLVENLMVVTCDETVGCRARAEGGSTA